ncbi:MAG TPA: hypothetical protein VIU61_25020 [Kofleriaceae bacterium]
MKLHGVGFWFNELAPSPYPRPHALVGRWRAGDRRAVLAHLSGGLVFESYRGRSFCRFACGARAMGHRDLTDGRHVWPEGLAHYVEHHDVQLPEWFVAAVGREPVVQRAIVDDAKWIAWGKARGAAVALAGWHVPTAAEERAIATRLTKRITRGHVLARRTVDVALAGDGAAVLRLSSGALAVVELATGDTQLLAGWDQLVARRRRRS